MERSTDYSRSDVIVSADRAIHDDAAARTPLAPHGCVTALAASAPGTDRHALAPARRSLSRRPVHAGARGGEWGNLEEGDAESGRRGADGTHLRWRQRRCDRPMARGAGAAGECALGIRR